MPTHAFFRARRFCGIKDPVFLDETLDPIYIVHVGVFQDLFTGDPGHTQLILEFRVLLIFLVQSLYDKLLVLSKEVYIVRQHVTKVYHHVLFFKHLKVCQMHCIVHKIEPAK